jgi:hypothetical protein
VGEARDQLKGKITPQENGVRDNVAFLSYLKSQASGFALSLSQHGEAQCTDVQLCALLAGYSDVSLHSEANYHEQIVHSLNRFNASHIADISKTSGLGAAFHRTTQCVVVKAGDQQRRAMVMVTQRADSGAARTEEIAEQFRQDQVNFLSWVDDDLAELADSVTASRIGDVVVVDILHMGMSGPLGEWAVRSAKQQMQTKKKAQV